MIHPPALRWGSASHPGRRTENQDHLLAAPPVFAVADGMGGHDSGSAASRSVVDSLAATAAGPCTGVDAVRSALGRADAEIRALGDRPDGRGAGTTVAGIACVEHGGAPYWAVFGLGDSRVYLWDRRGLTQLSTDHSVVQELLDEGTITAEQAARHPERHVITRALGVGEFGEADFALLPIESGQRLLLCSDGLSTEVAGYELGRHLAAGDPPQQTADALVRAALEAGGNDNVSVVVVDVLADELVDGGAESAPFDVDATIPRVPVLPESRA